VEQKVIPKIHISEVTVFDGKLTEVLASDKAGRKNINSGHGLQQCNANTDILMFQEVSRAYFSL